MTQDDGVNPPGSPERSDPFASLVADVASALDDAIPAWRVRVSAAAGDWRARGVDTTVLEQALALPSAPDVDGLLETFARAVEQLAAFEADAVAVDSSVAGNPVFRDPTRVRDAARLVAARRSVVARQGGGYPTGEHWVLQWPDAGDLLAGELA